MDSIELVDVLHSFQFIPVLELLTPEDILSLRYISKTVFQCLKQSVKWGSLFKQTKHLYCSIPTEPINDTYEQYLTATQTLFLWRWGMGEALYAVHPSSTLRDLILNKYSGRIFDGGVVKIVYSIDALHKDDNRLRKNLNYDVSEMMCSDLFVPGSELRVTGAGSLPDKYLYVYFGKGSYNWDPVASDDRIAIIKAPYYPLLNLQFTSWFMEIIVSRRAPRRVPKSLPYITSYLQSGRQWILCHNSFIYWKRNDGSDTGTGIRTIVPFDNTTNGLVYLKNAAFLFEQLLSGDNTISQNDDGLISALIWDVDNTHHWFEDIPVIDRVFTDRVVVRYSCDGFSLCIGSIQISTKFSTLYKVLLYISRIGDRVKFQTMYDVLCLKYIFERNETTWRYNGLHNQKKKSRKEI